MGFLDKIQQTAKETLDKGKEKLEDVQADRAADKLLRDLGAWYYAGRTGRDNGEAPGNVERLVAELQAHEAEHGQLGANPDQSPAAPAAAEAPAAPAADAPPPSSAATDVPPAAAAAPPPPPPPVTPGPPPPPAG